MNALSPSSALPLLSRYLSLACPENMNLWGGELDGSMSEIKPIVTIQYALEICKVHEI